MISKDSANKIWVDAQKATGAPAPVDARHIYIVECDAYELPEFHTRRDQLIPAHNHVPSISTGLDGDTLAGGMGDPAWYGGLHKWSEAVNIVMNGWPEGVAKATALSEQISSKLPEPESLRRRLAWGDDGDELDYDKFRSQGIDGAFRRTIQRVQKAPRTIKIVGNYGMDGGNSADAIAWNGAQLVALLDILERADYMTELVLGDPTPVYGYGDPHISMPCIRLKTATDPLNMSALMAVAGHAGVFRSLGFAADCSSPRQMAPGVGGVCHVREAWQVGVEKGVLEEPNCFIEQANSEKSALQNVIGALRQIFHDQPELLTALDTAIATGALKV
jgi:hypothetical protein